MLEDGYFWVGLVLGIFVGGWAVSNYVRNVAPHEPKDGHAALKKYLDGG